MPTPQSYFKDCGGDFTKLRLTPVTPWIAVYQAPLSMGFPGQEYCSELPFPSPGDLPDSGIKLVSPALAGEFFTTEPPGKPIRQYLSFYDWLISFSITSSRFNHAVAHGMVAFLFKA